jgi:hypothetical protein
MHMNEHDQNELEREISRELETLPPLIAPRTLIPRVLAALEAQWALPWYRRAWQMWPTSLQAASFAMLLAFFGSLCFGGWQMSHSQMASMTAHKFGDALSSLQVAVNAAGVLANAAGMAFKSFGQAVVIGSIAALVMGYGLCVALGTAAYRLAYARR